VAGGNPLLQFLPSEEEAQNPLARFVTPPQNPLQQFLQPEEPKEESWWENAWRGGAATSLSIGHALSRMGRGAAEAVYPEWLKKTPYFKRRFEEWEKVNQELGEDVGELAPADQRPFLERLSDRPIPTLIRTAAEVAPSLGSGLAATAVGGPAAGVAVGGGVGFSTSATAAYDESRAQGNDEPTSLAIGGVVGTLSALLEVYGLKGVAKPLKTAFGRSVTQRVARGETDVLVRQILAGASKEAGTEVGQELIAAAGEVVAGRPIDEVVAELDDRIAQAATGGLVGGSATGGVAIVGQRRRSSRSTRAATHALLEQAAGLEPTAWQELAQQAQPGEWKPESLPTGEWTTEAAREAHEALENVVAPNVLGKVKKGVRKVRGGVYRSSQLLSPEVPFVEIVRKGFGDKMGDEISDTFYWARKTTTANRTVVDAAVVNWAGEKVAPAYKQFLNLGSRVAEHPIEDPTGGKWLLQYTGERNRHGDLKLDRHGNRVMPDWLKKSAGNRYLEEARWGLQMEELGNRKAYLQEQLAELEARAQELVVDDELGAQIEDVRAQLGEIQFSDRVMADVKERMAWLRQHPQWGLLEKTAEGAAAWDQHMITMMADAEIISREQEAKILARGRHYAGFFVSNPSAQPAAVRQFMAKGAEEPGRLKVGLRRDAPLLLPSEASLFRATLTQQEASRQVAKNNLLQMVEAAPEFWAQAGVALEPIEGVHRPELYVRAKRQGETVPVYMPKDLLTAFEQLTPTEGNLFQRGGMSFMRFFANQRRVTALLTPTFAVGQTFRDQADAAIWAAEVGYRPWVEMGRGMLHMLTGSPEYRAFRAGGGGMGSIASTHIEQSQGLLAKTALHAREEDIQSTMRLAAARLHRFSKTWSEETFGSGGENVFAGAFYPMARLLETLDTSTRLGAYLRALDKGRSEAEAMAISRRSAIDFARGGESMNWLSQILPFSNARAQAFAETREAVKRAGRKETEARHQYRKEQQAELDAARVELENVRSRLGQPGSTSEELRALAREEQELALRVADLESPLGKATGWTISQAVALKAGAGALLPLFGMVVLPELIHWASHADDEDYHDRDDWEKQKYYFWFQKDDEEWLKSPRPIGYLSNLLGYGLGQALDEAYRDNPRTLENVLAVVQQDIPGAAEIPLGFGAHQNLVIFDNFADFGLHTNSVPPALEPLVVLASERSLWQQRLVVPEWQKRVRPRQQSFRTTHPVYVELAKLIPGNAEEQIFAASHLGEMTSRAVNVATGGRLGSERRFSTTAATSEKLTSPLWLEQAGRFVGGSVASELIRVGQLKEKHEAGEKIPLADIPVLRNFVQRAKDAPQMWPVRRVLELVEEGKALKDLKRKPGEGLSKSETSAYKALRERVEAGMPLSPEQEARYRKLELKSMMPETSDVLATVQYNALAERAQAIRELLTEYHEARRLGRIDVMEQIDEQIIQIAKDALAAYGGELGKPGSGWAAKWWNKVGNR